MSKLSTFVTHSQRARKHITGVKTKTKKDFSKKKGKREVETAAIFWEIYNVRKFDSDRVTTRLKCTK